MDELGVLKGSNLKIAIDTTPVLGREAVKDTYNLLGDGIRKLASVLARTLGQKADAWAEEHSFSRYWRGLSFKGEAEIDWSNDAERRVFLNVLVADAQRLLLVAERYLDKVDEDDQEEVTKDNQGVVVRNSLFEGEVHSLETLWFKFKMHLVTLLRHVQAGFVDG